MNDRVANHPIRFFSLTLALCLFCLPGRGDVIITNIELTSTTLSFDIAGTIDRVGPAAQDALFIGDPLNSAWISHTHTEGVWENHGGTYQPEEAYTNQNAAGGYVYANKGGTIEVGDSVDASFTFTGGNFDPSATDFSNWIVSAGFNGVDFILPDPAYSTGYVVPEPSSLLVFGLLGLYATRRRRS